MEDRHPNFCLKIICCNFCHVLDVLKAFCIQVPRHRLKYIEGTDGICIAYCWNDYGAEQTADDLGYVYRSDDRHSNVHDHIVVETLHFFVKILNKLYVTQYRNLETKILEYDAEK